MEADIARQLRYVERVQQRLDQLFGPGTQITVGWNGESFEELYERDRKRLVEEFWRENRGRTWTKEELGVSVAEKKSKAQKKRATRSAGGNT